MGKREEKILEVLKAYKEYQPPNGEEQFLREVFNKTSEELVTVCKQVPYYKLFLIQKALFSVLKDWKVKTRTKINRSGTRAPIEYVAFDIGYGTKEEAIKEGSIVLVSADDQRLVVRFETDYFDDMEEARPEVFLTCAREKEGWLEEVCRRIDDWMLKNNYFRGKKIKPDGKFLDIKKGGYTWDDIILDQTVKGEIIRNITDYFVLREIYQKNNLPSKRGIICYGPPGTGKTLLGKVLASQIGATFIWVSSSDVASAKSISIIFQMARELSPTILFFEDVDLFASIRDYNDNTKVLGELLVQMNGFIENNDLFIIATTNDIKVIEPALKNRPSRFDSLIEFKPFDEQLRARMMAQLLKDHKIIKGESYDLLARRVAKLTEGITGAEMKEFFIAALKLAVEKRCMDEQDRVILSYELFKDVRERIGIGQKRLAGFGGHNTSLD